MDLGLTETQELLKHTATEFMAAELPKKRIREIDESSTGFDPELWRRMSGLGWAGLIIPEAYGGAGRGYTDLGVLYEVLGGNAASSPHLESAVLSAQAILEAGDEAQKRSLLPAIAGGQQIFTFALTEPEYSWGPGGVRLQASQRNGGYVLNGTKRFVPWAHVADQLLVVARTSNGQAPEQGVSLFRVHRTAPGVSVDLMSGWLGHPACEVTFTNVQVASSDVIGSPGEAWPAIEQALDKATGALCAYMGGGAVKVYEMAREYSQTRIAFGVPIGTFQHVQAHVLEALDDAESTIWSAYEALSKLDEGSSDAALTVSGAKAVASVKFPSACDHSHDVHAGVGIDLDLGLTHFTKRSRTFQQYLGDAIHHKRRMARLLGM